MIIGIGGEKQHGKDTVARHLVKHYNYTQIAFADELKRLCTLAFKDQVWPHFFTDEHLKGLQFQNQIIAEWWQVEAVFTELINTHELHPHPSDLFAALKKYMAKGHFKSPRDILQFVGTDIIRDFIDEDFHYNTVVNFHRKHLGLNLAISDCRFKNERENLKRDFPDAVTLLVKRPSATKDDASRHISENSLGEDSEYDHVILNDGTLDQLHKKVDALMASISTMRDKGESHA